MLARTTAEPIVLRSVGSARAEGAELNQRARKKLDAQNRTTWEFSPVTKIVKSKKVYDRKKQPRNYEPYDSGGCFFITYSA